MAIEIERKFLVEKEKWEVAEKGQPQFLRQGYLVTEPNKTIRVRVTDTEGYITIKGISVGASRSEYEYTIPRQEGIELLDNFAISDLTKTRHKIHFEGKIWEIDTFFGENEGLIIAEIELESEDETFEKPNWVGAEVTSDKRYFNSYLSQNPFKNW